MATTTKKKVTTKKKKSPVDVFIDSMPSAAEMKGAVWVMHTSPEQLTPAGKKMAELANRLSQKTCFFCGDPSTGGVCPCVVMEPEIVKEAAPPPPPPPEPEAPMVAVRRMYLWEEKPAEYKALLAEGKINREAPAYEYACADCRQLVVVPHEVVAVGFQMYGQHRRRDRCAKCFSAKKRAQMRPRNGPGARPQRKPVPAEALQHKPFRDLIKTPETAS